VSIKLTGTPTAYWSDSDGTWTLPLNLGGSGSSERWQTPLAPLTGTVTGATTLAPAYYHQYKLGLEYSVSDGSSLPGPQPLPTFIANQFGTPLPTVLSTSVQNAWYDASTYTVSPTSYPLTITTVQWVLPAGESTGAIGSAGTLNFEYYHQFLVKFTYTVGPAGHAGSPSTPTVTYTSLGSSSGGTANDRTTYWVDAGSTPSYVPAIAGLPGEQWALTTPASSVIGTGTVTAAYTHQFYVTVVANGHGKITGLDRSGWYNAGASISFTGTPKAHHLFVDWTSNSAGLVIATPTTATTLVTIDGSGTITAWFR